MLMIVRVRASSEMACLMHVKAFAEEAEDVCLPCLVPYRYCV